MLPLWIQNDAKLCGIGTDLRRNNKCLECLLPRPTNTRHITSVYLRAHAHAMQMIAHFQDLSMYLLHLLHLLHTPGMLILFDPARHPKMQKLLKAMPDVRRDYVRELDTALVESRIFPHRDLLKCS